MAAMFVPKSATGGFPRLGAEGRPPVAMKQRARAIEEIGEKITRVVPYAQHRQYVSADRAVATYMVKPGEDEEHVADLTRGGERVHVPPGVFVAVRRAQDDLATVMALVDLWGHVRMFTSILSPTPS